MYTNLVFARLASGPSPGSFGFAQVGGISLPTPILHSSSFPAEAITGPSGLRCRMVARCPKEGLAIACPAPLLEPTTNSGCCCCCWSASVFETRFRFFFGLSSAWRTKPYCHFSPPGLGFVVETILSMILSRRPAFFLYRSRQDCHVWRVTQAYSGWLS